MSEQDELFSKVLDVNRTYTVKELALIEEILAKAKKHYGQKIIERIEKYVYYVDNRGYITLKPNATENWLALKEKYNV